MIYNYRSDETVQDVILECFYPLIEDISDEYSTLRRYENLSIYAPSYIAREILCRILNAIDNVWVHEESRSELLYKDDNEVIITIASDGMIFIENARTENVKLKCNYDCALTYVYDGFTKEDVDVLSENEDSILVFGFDEDTFEDEDDDGDDDGDDEGAEGAEDEELEYAEDDESETEHTYTVNGKPVNREEFDEYVSKFKETENNDNVDSGYSVTVKVASDAEEAEEMIRDMNRNLNRHVYDIFDMLYRPYLYEYRPHPIKFFW